MRILFLTQWFPPEPVHIVGELAESLVEHGHEVTVLTGFPNYPYGKLFDGYRQSLCHREQIGKLNVIRVPLYADHGRSAIKRALNYISFACSAALIGMWHVPKVDVIHVYHPPLTIGLPARWLSLWLRKPFTYEIQDMWPETLSATGMLTNKSILRCIGWFGQRVYRKAARIRVVTEGFRQNLIEKGVPASKIEVISSWVDTELYRPVTPDPGMAKSLGLEGRFNVMFAGTIGLAQGLTTVLDAAEQLIEQREVQFVLVGDGADLDHLRDSAKRRGLTNVLFLGRYPVEAMPQLYAHADVLLIHLRDDPLFRITIPYKVFAYLASGKPILAAAEGDVAQLVERTGSGVSCRSADAAAMAQCIRELRQMPREMLSAMGERGRKAACDSYSRLAVTRRVAEMLQSVVDRRRRKPAPPATLTSRRMEPGETLEDPINA